MMDFSKINFTPPASWMKIKTIDMHTGGEPLRIITDGLPEIKGSNILEKRRYFRENFDFIRTGLMWEPRGHADMYGAIITEPCSEDADFGTFFLHNEGYSTMCGHAIIALTKLAFETGMIEKDPENFNLTIDAPPGKIYAKGKIKDGQVILSSFKNVPSYIYLDNEEINVPGLGNIRFDIAFGGAFYAFVRSDVLRLKMIPENFQHFIDAGRRIKKAVMENIEIKHPFEEDLSFLYGTIFTGPAEDKNNFSRNVCIFAEGELDRSATGSGVSARAALHYFRNEIDLGQKVTIESILGSTMNVKVSEEVSYGGFKAVIPEVEGQAYFSGSNTFVFDPEDPFKNGFMFR